MATNLAQTSDSCKLCSKHFSDPRMLPCLHSFCYDCLVKHFDSVKSEYACPQCSEMFEIPDGNVEGLTKDLYATYVAEVADYKDKLQAKGEVFCDRCIASSESVAIKFCCNCCKFLCNWCTQDHMRREKTRKHELADVGEKKKKKDSQYEQTLLNSIPRRVMHCPQHTDEVLKFYCKKCLKLICRDCKDLFHSGHPCDRIEPIAEGEKAELLPHITEADFAARKLVDAMNKSGKVVQNIRARQKSVDDDIKNCFRHLREVLKYHENALLALSEEVGHGKITALQLQSDGMKSLHKEITRVSGHLTEAVETYTPAELLSAKELIVAKLSALMKKYKVCSLDPCKNESIHTDFDYQLVTEAVEQFGTISEGCYACLSTAVMYIPWAVKEKVKKVTVITRNFHGDLFTRGGEVVKARLALKESGEFDVEGEIRDNGDGTYEISVTPLSVGEHELSITLGNEPIKSSPLAINVWEKRDYASLKCQKQFDAPKSYDIAIHGSKQIFATDYDNHRIQVINMESGDNSAHPMDISGDLKLNNPHAIAIRDDILYVVDHSSHCVHKITTSGEHIFTFGCEGSGESQFKNPDGICFDPEGRIYISDYSNNRVSVFKADWTFDRVVTEKLNGPRRIALDNAGNLIVANSNTNTIEVFNPEGKNIGSYGSGQLKSPSGVAVDPEGYVFVSEFNGSSSRLCVFDPQYKVLDQPIKGFYNAIGVKLAEDGSVYVADSNNNKIKMLNIDHTANN